jgi:hypothetical protein
MSSIIFKKGKMQYFSQAIRKIGEGTKEYYSVDDLQSGKEHQVSIKETEEGLIFSCPCTHQSLHQPKGVICSHTISVILKKCSEVKIK